jgi:hypothetical protein
MPFKFKVGKLVNNIQGTIAFGQAVGRALASSSYLLQIQTSWVKMNS